MSAPTPRLPGPVAVAAGCGGTGRELAPFADLAGLDLVTRTLTLDARRGERARRVSAWPGGVLSTASLANPGLEHFLATELPGLVRAGVVVHVSIAGANPPECAALARRLCLAPGVAGLELDLGEPDPEGLGLMPTDEPYQAAAAVAAVRREFGTDRPLLVKLSPVAPRLVEVARACRDAGADAVVVGHAAAAALPDGTPAGLSGPAVRPLALRALRLVAEQAPTVPLVGCGGVVDEASMREHLAAGAHAVQVGSALFTDPLLLDRLRAAASEPPARTPDPDPDPSGDDT